MSDPNFRAEKFKPAWFQLIPIILALAYFAIFFTFLPFRQKIQLDNDEGMNAMRALLVAQGHTLYEETYSDQPPLFTFILAGVYRSLGNDVNAMRLVVLGFSALLVWGLSTYLLLGWGFFPAIFFPVFLFVTPYLVDLSVSVMIGIPSIALASASLAGLALWHRYRSAGWLVFSAVMLALSVLTKLMTIFLAPVFLAGIVLASILPLTEKRNWKDLQPALLWILYFALTVIVLGLLMVRPQNVSSLIFPHIEAQNVAYFQEKFTLLAAIEPVAVILGLGLIGLVVAISTRRWLMLYVIAWGLLAYLLLVNHTPVWYHHTPLLTVPATVLWAGAAGQGLYWLVEGIKSPPKFIESFGLAVLVLLLTIPVWWQMLPDVRQQFDNEPIYMYNELGGSEERKAVLATMEKYAPVTNWILTDEQMYAFRIDRPVPPFLATLSSKRLQTGELTSQKMISIAAEFEPEMILISRFEYEGLDEYLAAHYSPLISNPRMSLYARNDIVANSEPAVAPVP